MAKENKNNWLLPIIIVFVVITLVFFPYNMLKGKGILGFILNTNEYDKLGQFISGITSPIAIILLYLTYTSQKEELQASKGILKNKTEHLKNSSLNPNYFRFYIFSDGYADQFNAINKKLMTKRFKDILISISGKSMQEQKEYLDSFLENWKGNIEQVDDVLVIGIRV